jgi:Holliday junction DNA helicase RuvB
MEYDFNIRKEEITSGDKEFERQLRPLTFSDFKGQQKIIDNLKVFVNSCKKQG